MQFPISLNTDNSIFDQDDMSTIFPAYDKKPLIAETDAARLQSGQMEIMRALHSETKYIVLIGKKRSSRNRLLSTLAQNITTNSHLIFVRGKDLSFSTQTIKFKIDLQRNRDRKSYIHNFSLLIDHIIQSIKSNKKLVVMIDDADSLIAEKLTSLFKINAHDIAENHTVQFILVGSPGLQKKLQSIDYFTAQNIMHSSIDVPNKKTIGSISSNRQQAVISDKNESEFNQDLFEVRADFEYKPLQTLRTFLNRFVRPTKQTRMKMRRTKSDISDLAYNQNLFEVRADFEHKSLQVLTTFFNRFFKSTKSISAKKQKTKPNVNSFNFKQVLIKAKDGIKKPLYQTVNLFSAGSATLANFLFAKKLKLFNTVKRFVIERKNYARQLCESTRNSNSRVKSKIEVLISKTRGVLASILKHYDLMVDAIIKFLRQTIVTFSNKIKQTHELLFAKKGSSSWNISSALMALVVTAVFLVSYRMQDGNIEPKIDNQQQLVEKNSNIIPTDIATVTKESKVLSLEKTDKPNTTVESIVDMVSLEDELSVDNTDIPVQSDSISKEQELDRLLVLAAQQFKAKKLTTPAGDNAYETYQFILFTAPKHPAALKGIKKIHDKYISWANYYIQNDETNRAKGFLNKALMLEPQNEKTLSALKGLEKLKSDFVNRKNLLLLTQNEPTEVQIVLAKANEKLQQIETGLASNNRDYQIFLDAQMAYQKILKRYPYSEAAKAGLLIIKSYYLNWADLESQNKNYNTSSFLYKQAQSIPFSDADIKQQIDKIQIISYEDS